jgi:acyl-phosphate glycerol 3-phosphate acyltransferase
MDSMYTIIFTIAAYLVGSISFAVIVSRAFGLSDPRTYGSKNPGATNVLRSGSKKAAIATLLGDCAKGWPAAWRWWRSRSSSATCGRCSSASSAARAWRPRWACCSA